MWPAAFPEDIYRAGVAADDFYSNLELRPLPSAALGRVPRGRPRRAVSEHGRIAHSSPSARAKPARTVRAVCVFPRNTRVAGQEGAIRALGALRPTRAWRRGSPLRIAGVFGTTVVTASLLAPDSGLPDGVRLAIRPPCPPCPPPYTHPPTSRIRRIRGPSRAYCAAPSLREAGAGGGPSSPAVG